MKHGIKEVITALGGAAALLGFALLMWTVLALVGISEGSTDLCTESFKETVRAIVQAISRVG